MKFLILNGPNVNIMRWSEPGVPGELDYNAMMDYVQAGCDQLGIETDCCQSNHEGDLVDEIQAGWTASCSIPVPMPTTAWPFWTRCGCAVCLPWK